jgi:hypothetical protein
VSVLAFSLAQLASMAENMERGGGGGGATQHNFTLADLISNVSEVRDSGVQEFVPNPPGSSCFDFADPDLSLPIFLLSDKWASLSLKKIWLRKSFLGHHLWNPTNGFTGTKTTWSSLGAEHFFKLQDKKSNNNLNNDWRAITCWKKIYFKKSTVMSWYF